MTFRQRKPVKQKIGIPDSNFKVIVIYSTENRYYTKRMKNSKIYFLLPGSRNCTIACVKNTRYQKTPKDQLLRNSLSMFLWHSSEQGTGMFNSWTLAVCYFFYFFCLVFLFTHKFYPFLSIYSKKCFYREINNFQKYAYWEFTFSWKLEFSI